MITLILFALLLSQILTEEVSFPTAMKNLEILESYAKSYKAYFQDETPIIQLVSCYIRSKKYSDEYWIFIAGYCSEHFANYVSKKDKESNTNVASILDYDELKVRTNEKIDFVHFFAVINGLFFANSYTNEASGLVGWAGDLAQLFQDVQGAIYNTTDELYNIADEFFGKKGQFGPADLISDLDAPIILSKVKKENKSLATVITEYYENEKLTQSSRIKEFINLTFPNVTEITESNLREAVYNSYSQNWLIKRLECSYGFRYFFINCIIHPFGLKKEFINHPQVVCNLFADYLYKNSK